MKVERIHCDLLVTGGTLEGCIAAIMAARAGREVWLVEKSGCMGGMSSNGLAAWMQPVVGEGAEIRAELLTRLGCGDGPEGALYPDQRMKIALGEMLRESGVNWLTHVFLSEPLTEDGALKGFLVNGKTGPIRFEAARVIDATDTLETAGMLQLPWKLAGGRISVAVKCNGFNAARVPMTELARPAGGRVASLVAPFSATYRGLRAHCDTLNLLLRDECEEALVSGLVCDLRELDALTLSDAQLCLSRFAYALRDELRRSVPGMENLNIIHIAPLTNAYGLRRCENPWTNLILLNNDGMEYSNALAVEKGGRAAR